MELGGWGKTGGAKPSLDNLQSDFFYCAASMVIKCDVSKHNTFAQMFKVETLWLS